MKLFLLIFLHAVVSLTLPAGTPVTENDQIKEYVRVSQVELVVRALSADGTPKAGLKAEDFTVYEYDSPVPVTSCTEIRRHLGTIDRARPAVSKDAAPRIILVYLWIWQQNHSLDEALDYLFHEVYRDGDTVILMLPAYSEVISARDQIATARINFRRQMVGWTQRVEQDIQSTMQYFNSLCDDFVPKFRARQGGGQEPEDLTFVRVFNEFKSIIQTEWRSFQQRHLEANHRRLLNLANALRTLKNEKWALVFFQQPVFPALHPYANLMLRLENQDYINRLRQFAHQMIRDLNSPRNTPAQLNQIEDAFIHAGATYQLVEMDSRPQTADQTRHLVLRNVFSDWRLAFQRVARATGGRVVNDNHAMRALSELVNAEDVFYRVTYAPRRVPANRVIDRRRVKVAVRDQSLRVFHREHIHLSEVDEIKLIDFECRPDRLYFTLSGYSIRLEKGSLHSSVQVWLTAETPQGETLEFERSFTAPEPFLDVSMALKFPRPGPYRIYFSAVDRHTGLSVSRTHQVQVRRSRD